MAFIYVLYLVVVLLVFVIFYLLFDYYQIRKELMIVPIKLQDELNDKIRIHEKQQLKLSILFKTQQNIEEKVIQIDQYLKQVLESPPETQNDIKSVQIMELNTQFAIDQIHKSMYFIEQMKDPTK